MWNLASLFVASAALIQPGETLSYDDIARWARPSAAELAVDAEIAELRRTLATSSRGLVAEPVLQVAAGPRWDHDDDETRGDVEVELALPWRKRSPSRQRLEELVDEATPALTAAAASTAALALRHAYVDAWRVQELLALREDVHAAATRLAEIAHARESAGADPPFEAQLVSLELDEAASALVAARAALAESWLKLAGLAEVPDEAPRLVPPAFLRSGAAAAAAERCANPSTVPTGTVAVSLPEVARRSAAWRAAELRAELSAARSELDLDVDLSRFSWIGSVAREGREDVARLGVALALPRPGVQASRRDAAAASVRSVQRGWELTRAELSSRWASATVLLRSTPIAAGAEDRRYAETLAAIEARLAAGRASPAETLVLRRQVLMLREQALERAALREHATAELIALCTPVESEVEEVTP